MPGDGLARGPPAKKVAGGSYHRFSRIIRHSLRGGFNSVLRALPGNRALLLPSSARSSLAGLTPASGCQDHATSLSAMRRSSAQQLRSAQSVHRIPRSTYRDDRPKRPSCRARDGADHASVFWKCQAILRKTEQALLRQNGTTGNLHMVHSANLPVGQDQRMLCRERATKTVSSPRTRGPITTGRSLLRNWPLRRSSHRLRPVVMGPGSARASRREAPHARLSGTTKGD
jgi:hypothetical protein